MSFIGVVITAFVMLLSCQKRTVDVQKNVRAGYSYALGVQMAENLKKQGIDLDLAAFESGFSDAYLGKQLKLTSDQVSQKLFELQNELNRKIQEQAEKNLKEAQAFLEKNRQNPGVQVLPSGVQIRFIQRGTGPIPQSSDVIRVHYRGRLINGQEFDSSYSRNQPAQLPVQGLIPGWVQAIAHIPVGSKVELVIPPELGYGSAGRPGIPPNSVLIFELELLGIVGKD